MQYWFPAKSGFIEVQVLFYIYLIVLIISGARAPASLFATKITRVYKTEKQSFGAY